MPRQMVNPSFFAQLPHDSVDPGKAGSPFRPSLKLSFCFLVFKAVLISRGVVASGVVLILQFPIDEPGPHFSDGKK